MYEQMSIFQRDAAVGDYVGRHGRKLTFDEIAARVGCLIVMDTSTQSHAWFKIVLVESIITYSDGQRRLVYFDGHKQRGLVDERYFNGSISHPARAYELQIKKIRR